MIRQLQFEGMSYDAEAWPLVIFEMHNNVVTVEHETYMHRVWGSAFERRQPFYVISDVWLTTQPDALSRRRIVDVELALSQLTAEYQLGSVVIPRSTLVRTLYRGILWFRPRPFPQTVAGDREEAVRVARAEMTKLGFPISEAIEAKLKAFLSAGSMVRPS